jgi:hypothetical protein
MFIRNSISKNNKNSIKITREIFKRLLCKNYKKEFSIWEKAFRDEPGMEIDKEASRKFEEYKKRQQGFI